MVHANMIDKELLDILACPETKADLELADQGLIDRVNASIEQSKVLNRSKQKVTDTIDGGLLRKGDGRFLYPIRDNIPILLVEELISLENL